MIVTHWRISKSSSSRSWAGTGRTRPPLPKTWILKISKSSGPRPHLDFENFSKKKLFFLFRVVKSKFRHFFPPLEKLWKNPRVPPPGKKSFDAHALDLQRFLCTVVVLWSTAVFSGTGFKIICVATNFPRENGIIKSEPRPSCKKICTDFVSASSSTDGTLQIAKKTR